MSYIETPPLPAPAQGARLLALGFGAFTAITVTLSALDLYPVIHPNAFPATILLANVLLVTAYFTVPSINALGRAMGPYHLAYFHVWRVIAGAIFVYLGASGTLNPTFTDRAGFGDILAGLIAGALILLPRRTAFVATFHVVGFADLLLVIATGIYINNTAPETLAAITLLPLSLIPLVGVPISILSHVAALEQVFRGWRA
ncbi:MAG: hypothetical protein AAGA47_02700 [Pseudomonadota bacterium]